LSSYGPHEDRAQCTLDDTVRVRACTRCSAPDAVYNLRVAPDHAYYAEGILVHNCDDPHNVLKVESDGIRAQTNLWWRETMSTRGLEPERTARVIIMQRSHHADLAAQVLAQGDYAHLCLPMEYEPSRVVPVRTPTMSRDAIAPTPLGFIDPRLAEGDLLCPARFDHRAVVQLKRDLGAHAYAGQAQQRPSAREGSTIKRDDLRYWKVLPAGRPDGACQSWDFAFKASSASSYVVGQVWLRYGGAVYLVDEVRARMAFGASVQALKALSAKYPHVAAKLIEDRANGPAVLDELKLQIGGIIPYEPRGSKEARLEAVSPYFESHVVFAPDPLLEGYGWVGDWINEVCAAPHGAYSDRADACSQALDYLYHLQKSSKLQIFAVDTRTSNGRETRDTPTNGASRR